MCSLDVLRNLSWSINQLHAQSPEFWQRSTNDALLTDHWCTPQWVKQALRRKHETFSMNAGRGSFVTSFDRDCRPVSPQRNEYSWTALISQHTKSGQGRRALRAYEEMQKDGVKPSSYTFVALLKACSNLQDLESAKKIHADVVRTGFASDLYVGTMLVDVYAKCRSLVDARDAFEKMPCRNVVSWTAMILGYAQLGMGEEGLKLYTRMKQEGVVPNDRTFVSVLKACSSLAELEERNEGGGIGVKEGCLQIVRAIHTDIVKKKFESDVFVGTMLVDVYAKCGRLEDARRVFEKMPDRNVVSWNAIILGYAQMGKGEEALQLYARMRQEGVVPDDRTYVSVLKACSAMAEAGDRNEGEGESVRVGCLETVRSIHADAVKAKFESDVYVGNILVDVYAKCRSLEDARWVFEKMPRRDVVSWNAMILGYAQMDKGEVALQLYSRMQQEGIAPNRRTYIGALNACGSVAGLEKGKEIHEQIVKARLDSRDSFVTDSLIDMYGKCGSMVDAQQVFDAMPNREIVAWNTLIAGYVHQGESDVVLDLFQRMQQENVVPDDVTFLSVLTVCSHGGMVDTGQKYFQAMSRDYGISPTIKHFTCMVDLLGRSGQLGKAMEVVKAMPFKPDNAVWKCILAACQKWSDVELGSQAFECAVRLNKDDAATYVLMSNIYAAANMLEEAKEMQAMRVKIQSSKHLGWSRWTDVGGVAHVFGDDYEGHPESQEVDAKLSNLLVKMKKEGYEPQKGLEEDAMCGHSVKLAITYALQKTHQGTTIRVVENARVCEDCHRVCALISRIEQRIIICRDASRFHVYEDGNCSCRDYW